MIRVLATLGLLQVVWMGFARPATAQGHEAIQHLISMQLDSSGVVTFKLESMEEGHRRTVLPGVLSIARCDPDGRDRYVGPQKEAMLWSVRGDFRNQAASEATTIRYGTVPSGWTQTFGPVALPRETCLVAMALTRWGPYHALVGFNVRENGTVEVLWRRPEVDRRT